MTKSSSIFTTSYRTQQVTITPISDQGGWEQEERPSYEVRGVVQVYPKGINPESGDPIEGGIKIFIQRRQNTANVAAAQPGDKIEHEGVEYALIAVLSREGVTTLADTLIIGERKTP